MLSQDRSLRNILGGIFILTVTVALFYYFSFAPPKRKGEMETFVVSLQTTESEVVTKLLQEGFIRKSWAFRFTFSSKNGIRGIEPGGYHISKSMGVWKIAEILSQPPAFVWIIIREGLRKEEISKLLAQQLHWNQEQERTFTAAPQMLDWEIEEGMFFPDTYLLPRQADGVETARRIKKHFDEIMNPLFPKLLEANIKWDTAVTLASLIEREAAGQHDMPLIAGILWNRLQQGMKLDIDATLQYAKGKTEQGWWGKVSPQDKSIDSPYNTYRHAGLPPQPISNPGLDAILAVLNPQITDCFYYLHDRNRQIHCAKTYEEHKENIQKFLR